VNTSTFIFTVTTGRSGTQFLTEFCEKNLTSANTYHERTNPLTFGFDTPDASDLMQFNNIGVSQKVRRFWRTKFTRISKEIGATYVETSHFLCKAGLVENLDLVPVDARVRLVFLDRDTKKIVRSFVNRGTFRNFHWTWLSTLDPRWVNVIIRPGWLSTYGPMGYALWYVLEMKARAAFYAEMVDELPAVKFVRTSPDELGGAEGATRFLEAVTDMAANPTIPGKANATGRWGLTDRQEALLAWLIENVKCDPFEEGARFFHDGFRLADASVAFHRGHLRRA